MPDRSLYLWRCHTFTGKRGLMAHDAKDYPMICAEWPGSGLLCLRPDVKRRLRKPSGPCRSSRIDRIKPTTTGGSPKPVLQIAGRTARPGNFAQAIQAPSGTPSAMLEIGRAACRERV